MIFKILLGILVVVASIVSTILRKIKKNQVVKRQEAAYSILREEALDYALQQNGEKFRMDQKIMLQIKEKTFEIDSVFDPEKSVTFGRAKENNIVLNSPTISGKHCRIIAQNGGVYLEDLHSSNGTMLKSRGKKVWLDGGQSRQIYSRDKVIIGGLEFTIFLFALDKRYFNRKR